MSIGVKIEAQYEQFVGATQQLKEFFGGVMQGMKDQLKDMSEAAKAEMKGHESASEQFANVLKNSMKGVTGAVEGVKIAWAQLAVIFEAAHFLGETVSKTVELTTEAQKLGRTLGISATQASYLSLAIGDVHGTSDQFIGAAKGLDQQLKSHEDLMNRAGLATRDASGALKDQQTLVMDGLEVLRGYKEGTDRNIAATQIFGKGVQISSEMLDLNAEKLAAAKEKADALGLAIGGDDVEASDRFRAAMNDMHDIIDAVMKTIGSALLPVLDDLAEWFTSYGPQALLTIRVAIDLVITVFKGLALAVKVVWDVVKLAFNNMVSLAQGFAQVFTALFHGDFEGAKNAAVEMMHGMQENIGSAFENIVNEAAATGSAVSDMWAKTIAGPQAPKDSGVAGGGTEEADTSKIPKVKDTSAADARRALAEQKRLLKEKYDALMEEYRGEEQAAKDNLQKVLEIQKKELEAAKVMYGDKSKEAEKAENRIAETQRKIAEQQQRMDERAAATHRILMGDRIDEEEAADQAREQRGEITTQKLIQLEVDYEQRRYELERQGLIEEAALDVDRVEDHQQTLLKMEELDSAHQGRVAALNTQAANDKAQAWQHSEQIISSAGANALTGLITKTMTWRQAVTSAFTSITQGFVQMFSQWAAKSAAHYLLDLVHHKTNLAAKAAADKAAAAAKAATDKAAAAVNFATQKAMAAASIATAVGIAGANGVASFAAAPWPIDVGAPAFGAAMAAAAGGFGAIAAAEDGFDVPRGVNPITQLHQNEMVLPSKYADVIRGMSDGGGGGGAGDTHHWHIHAVDAPGVRRFFLDNKRELAAAVKSAFRDGVKP